MSIRHVVSTAMLVMLSLAASRSAAAQTALEDPIPQPIAIGAIQLGLEPMATGLTAPNWGTFAPGCTARRGQLFVTDQDGILWRVNLATGQKGIFLDVSDRLVNLGAFGPGSFDERGLLGVAFHPAFATNGLLYTYTSEPVDGPADFSTMPVGTPANHQSVVLEWQVPNPCNAASVVDPASARELLRIDEPQFNHDGGALTFGPDGQLYVSLGDGGAADDQGVGHVEGGNGQAPDNILGSIIRIDPLGTNSQNGQYGIPPDNPFAGLAGFVEEIFAYGFRNPFRFSFDSATGEMYVADVGQNDIEEISIGVAGGNFGWRIKEGSFCFDPNGASPGFVFRCGPGDTPGDLIDPIAEYDHDEGIAIVGGFVYRGRDIPQLRGRYVFGDYSHPPSDGGRLFYLQKNNRILEFQLAGQDTLGLNVLGFGQDTDGELYLLANETGVPFGETGVVLRLTPAQGNRSHFRAHLAGDGEVPPVDTRAQGQATFHLDDAMSRMDFKLIVANIEDVFASHIHCAPAGANGPVGVTLFAGAAANPDGVLAEGSIVQPDAGNACGWTTLEQVVQAIRFGLAYVNVHTLAHPPGEIRGQVR